MEKTTKMVDEITRKRKMTPEVTEKLHKRIFYNCLIAIGVMLYICAIDVLYIYAKPQITAIALKVFAMVAIIVTILVFEVAYRKDSGKIAIIGIEMLIFSIVILYIPKIYVNLDKKFCLELVFIPVFCAIYYIAKSIVIYIKTEKHYQNNLSDVKEIMKQEI